LTAVFRVWNLGFSGLDAWAREELRFIRIGILNLLFLCLRITNPEERGMFKRGRLNRCRGAWTGVDLYRSRVIAMTRYEEEACLPTMQAIWIIPRNGDKFCRFRFCRPGVPDWLCLHSRFGTSGNNVFIVSAHLFQKLIDQITATDIAFNNKRFFNAPNQC